MVPRVRKAEPDATPQVGYASGYMFATTPPGLLEVIGIPIAFVLLSAGACLGLLIVWNRARS
jgi:hypothetical protein